ncbi:MAG: Glycosyl transferase family 2 [Microgenomates group bacterium GW2011_GWA2_44_7]|nr:MAG: Glycosyl transferase family 2 [Microgenomates group bacterium GW2011_GWA2_44_7]KKT78419.1 MAG: Glycosyl transferase family 2 [Microgenomates group bacterium GW2011_GWB1_44_8]
MASLISVVITTRNEEKYLPQVLSSVKELADEILIVDIESRDNSVEVAKKFGARVISHKYINYVEPVRNFGVSQAKGDWILVLDPDEEVSPKLRATLKAIAKKPEKGKITYYAIPRKNIVFGKWIQGSRWWPDYKIRFFKKGTAIWSGEIHHEPKMVGEGKKMTANEEIAIIHYHYDSIEKFILWANRYADVRCAALLKNGYSFQWEDLIRKPFGEFLSRYFFGKGYKDGLHGLALGLLQGFAEVLVLVKVWERQGFIPRDISLTQFQDEAKSANKEFSYWLADSLIKTQNNPIEKFRLKLIRKLSS